MRPQIQPVDRLVGRDESSSDEEESGSLKPITPLKALPDRVSESHNGTHATPLCAETLVQENAPINPIDEKTVIHARAYQIEMFEKSLERNIIVAMDTGSGKTQVYGLFLNASHERSISHIIWFLAPTVALCEQQFRVIKSQIGVAQIKMLSGADNVDTWSNASTWDDYLRNVRVVVSTYQVLLDAITHAFVQMGQLCLIIFDEAHNCVGKHAGNNGMPCPAILGLTASPIIRSSLDGIEKIEQTLDAICKAPTLHREELLFAVKRPTLSSTVIPNSGIRPIVASVTSFAKVFRNLDIFRDPYVLRLQSRNDKKSSYNLQKALDKLDTPVMKQMKSTYRKSTEIHRELGPWASEYFIYEAITRFLQSVEDDLTWFETWNTTDKQYLANVLRQVEIKLPRLFRDATPLDLSNKFISLVRELQSVPEGTRCIIFVLETTTVAVLAHMLSNTASISDHFRVGTMIGTSNYMGGKRELGDLNQVKNSLALEDFRTGKLNLLVATSVAEEGIDVPACNLVICFNAPPNVKSFIQRRGRARMESSRIILLSDGSSEQHDTWIALENTMKRYYEDDMRVLRELAELEDLDDRPDIAPLRIPSTGAQLDFDQAKSHLEHFCQKITSGQYIERRPYYIPEKVGVSPNGIQMLSATAHLPPSLPKALRRVKGLRRWYSERNAFKDAAFQAFKAVYKAGLVNDNLMPLVDDILEGVEARSSMMEVNGIWKPWQKVAQLWGESNERIQRELLLKDGNRVIAKFEASLPCQFPELPPFNIYWDANNTWTVELGNQVNSVTADSLKEDQSAALIDLAFGHRWRVENLAHILHLQSTDSLPFREHVGQRAVEKGVLNSESVVRSTCGKPHLFVEWLPCRPPLELVRETEKDAWDEDGPWLALRKWPRRQDLLHPVLFHPESSGRYRRALPVSRCTLDTVDRFKVSFGSVIPSIIHMLEVHLIAEELCNTILNGVGFSNMSLVVTAISSPAARWLTNYERFEFLGDSILKLLATVSVMIQKSNYSEGFLSAMKDRIVSNSRLCRVSVEKGLDRFILTDSFTGRKWRPLYIKDLLSAKQTHPTRQMSTKTLADVVESLIGAAYIDGGMPKAMACLQILLPEVEWHDLGGAHTILSGRRDIVAPSHPGHERLEQLVGYEFQNKALLTESLTHASWNLETASDVCMERLEFLGDPILDNIIVSILWTHEPELSHNQMHLLRTACVNADLLGFLVIGWCTTQEVTEISATLDTITTQKFVPFWKYMRHGSPDMAIAQQAAEQRYIAERDAILDVITHGGEYPWAQLAHLAIPKFFSDMFESLLGAIWIDSGSMEACKEAVERIGIVPYLRRMLSDNVDVRHPKNKLGELVGRDGNKVRYETEVRAEEGAKDLLCRVFINEQFVVEVKGGVKPEEVITKAADEAYHILLRRANDVDDVMMT
ncbi:RNase3 domain-containing protein [Xylaria sp. FL0064]|nr:RNase3 domain-containing protein [Xylaria sp. FL0064]